MSLLLAPSPLPHPSPPARMEKEAENTNCGEECEQEELSKTMGGNTHWFHQFGRQFGNIY